MPGARGPIPKRSDQTIRRNEPEIPIDKIPAIGEVPIPALGIPNPHPLVKALFESLKDSAQTTYYEPSDWATANITMHFLNKLLRKREPSAMMLSAVESMMSKLLLTEGDRRRVRIEVERNKNQTEAKVFDVADRFRDMFQQPPAQ